ncbi:DUF6364 family protein [Mucilaginibacter paludis]|uniref:Antitoxin n=1 Tax=Mucilaginibacter paludis DSM 18603 TaxID=714943 RepID=H1YGM5_9SPHI|nr:DUF6364 family protein [Mucilaginibacter paludis]EHQ25411.1 hypothetical protein Mucpa_1247 [Mucilaginibacter paludis DSM 18603]
MAASKLTLSIEPEVIERAKKYAREKHVSLSKLVQNYLKGIDQKENTGYVTPENEIPDDILKLTGILKGKVPGDLDVWDAKYEYLKEKYDL